MSHEKARTQLEESFLASCKYNALDYHQRLNVLSLIPEDVSVNAAYGTIRIETTDPKVMTKVARALDSKVEKCINEYSQKGQMKIYLPDLGLWIYSQNIDLPETCTFKKVTKTIEVLEPSGDCGPWFKKAEAQTQS